MVKATVGLSSVVLRNLKHSEPTVSTGTRLYGRKCGGPNSRGSYAGSKFIRHNCFVNTSTAPVLPSVNVLC